MKPVGCTQTYLEPVIFYRLEGRVSHGSQEKPRGGQSLPLTKNYGQLGGDHKSITEPYRRI